METENTQQQVDPNTNLNQSSPPPNPILNQRGNFLLIIGVVLVLVIGVGGYYLGTQKNTAVQNSEQNAPKMTTTSLAPTMTQPATTFQKLLAENCPTKTEAQRLSGEIAEMALETLPLTIKLDDLKSNKGYCDSGNHYNNFILIPLGEENSFMTISDKNSSHCCHGPSSITPAGRLIKTQGDISIYIHTGTWDEGPNSGYKPIIVRGVKSIKLSNGEEIRVVLDRKALDKNATNLQKIEDKYQVIDPNFDSGVKVLTPETVEKVLIGSFFSNFSDSPVVKKVESDLQSVSIKN